MTPDTVPRGTAGKRGTAGGPPRPRAMAHPGPMQDRDEGHPMNRPDPCVRAVPGAGGHENGGHENGRPAPGETTACPNARLPGSPRAPEHVRDRRGERPAAGVTRALDRGAGGDVTVAVGDVAP